MLKTKRNIFPTVYGVLLILGGIIVDVRGMMLWHGYRRYWLDGIAIPYGLICAIFVASF